MSRVNPLGIAVSIESEYEFFVIVSVRELLSIKYDALKFEVLLPSLSGTIYSEIDRVSITGVLSNNS